MTTPISGHGLEVPRIVARPKPPGRTRCECSSRIGRVLGNDAFRTSWAKFHVDGRGRVDDLAAPVAIRLRVGVVLGTVWGIIAELAALREGLLATIGADLCGRKRVGVAATWLDAVEELSILQDVDTELTERLRDDFGLGWLRDGGRRGLGGGDGGRCRDRIVSYGLEGNSCTLDRVGGDYLSNRRRRGLRRSGRRG